jgi:poly(3-hydroxybutyrate) depolymerase
MYAAYAFGHSLAAPVNAWARAFRAFWSQAPFGHLAVAATELVERATRRYPKVPFATEHAIVERTPFCDLLRFTPTRRPGDPRVLLVAPLSGHHATLLHDTVATLVPDHDVYVTDWVDARLVPAAAGGFDLDDYIDLVKRFIGTVGPGAHVVAVCQPSVPVLAAVALMAEDGDAAVPQTMTLMGGPIDTRRSPTAPDRLATTHSLAWFERTLIHRVPAGEPGTGRRVYPGFLQLAGFLAMNPGRHTEAHFRFWRDLVEGNLDAARAHRRFYDDYLAVMDLPAEYYLQTVASVFQRHDLALGQMRSRGRLVRPAAIRDTALFTIEGELDDITGIGQSEAAHALCTGIPAERRRHHLQHGVGHYGVFSGGRWRNEIAPRLADFIRS